MNLGLSYWCYWRANPHQLMLIGSSGNLVQFIAMYTKSGLGNHKGLPLLTTANPEDSVNRTNKKLS